MVYFAFARPDTRIQKHFRRDNLDELMPHLGQLRISAVAVVNLTRRVRLVWAVLVELPAIQNYQGLIFPQNFCADAGGTHPPPNLATSLKEKR